MARLGELLVAAGVLSAEQVDRALRAQVMWGARLGTNLIELGFIDLDTLSTFLAQQHQRPAALARHFEKVDRDLQRMLHPDLAELYTCLPLVRAGARRDVVLAASSPLTKKAQARIADELAVEPDEIILAIAAELRMRYQLERVYNIQRPARFMRSPGKTIPPFPQFEIDAPELDADDVVEVEPATVDVKSTAPFLATYTAPGGHTTVPPATIAAPMPVPTVDEGEELSIDVDMSDSTPVEVTPTKTTKTAVPLRPPAAAGLPFTTPSLPIPGVTPAIETKPARAPAVEPPVIAPTPATPTPTPATPTPTPTPTPATPTSTPATAAPVSTPPSSATAAPPVAAPLAPVESALPAAVAPTPASARAAIEPSKPSIVVKADPVVIKPKTERKPEAKVEAKPRPIPSLQRPIPSVKPADKPLDKRAADPPVAATKAALDTPAPTGPRAKPDTLDAGWATDPSDRIPIERAMSESDGIPRERAKRAATEDSGTIALPNPRSAEMGDLDALSAELDDALSIPQVVEDDNSSGRERRRYLRTIADAPSESERQALGRIAIRRLAVAHKDGEAGNTLGEATRAIRRATDRDRVADLCIDTLFRFAPSCAAASLLVVRGQVATTWKGFIRDGSPPPEIAVPLDQPGLIPKAVHRNATVRAPSTDLSPIDQLLMVSLAQRTGELVVVPISIAKQVMCVIALVTTAEPPIATTESVAAGAGAAFARLMRDASR